VNYIPRAEKDRPTASDSLYYAELAAYDLLEKFHIETECGSVIHWIECQHVCDSFGYDSWDSWNAIVTMLRGEG